MEKLNEAVNTKHGRNRAIQPDGR